MKKKKILTSVALLLTLILSACTPKVTESTTEVTTLITTTETTATETEATTATETEATATDAQTEETTEAKYSTTPAFNRNELVGYVGDSYIEVNENKPFFEDKDFPEDDKEFLAFEELDELNRTGMAYGYLSHETMPAEGEERGEIGKIKPSGWQTVKYPDTIPDKYLYNRCHLIGWQLCGENANEKNLITGTRYLNIEGMLPFENKLADYLRDNEENKVLYRVTPLYTNDNLIADGVLLEALSKDKEFAFCVYCYNVQPGIKIDYATGLSEEIATATETDTTEASSVSINSYTYILNKKSMKIHMDYCNAVYDMKPQNKEYTTKGYQDLIDEGYTPCQICNPK
jgi:hypothetical protein